MDRLSTEETNEIVFGRKTFFIGADVTLFPDSFLEDYLVKGYECYVITEDYKYSLKQKIDIILSLFKDAIIFFYIDSKFEGIEWPVFIKDLQCKYGNSVLIGVLYMKRPHEAEKAALERYYLFDVGVQCGCIAMEYQRPKNFSRIAQVLYANQACGRRKNVRAMCDSTSEVKFDHNGKSYSARLKDISLNHFSCIFDHPVDMQMFERVDKIFLLLNGMHFVASGTLMMQRPSVNGTLYIYVFIRQDGSQGVNPELENRLVHKIYQIVTSKTRQLIEIRLEDMIKEQNSKG